MFEIMKVIKARKILKALIDDGWTLKHQVGSHAQYVHPTKPGKGDSQWHR
jgi:predicted RNA binding protein YcfA (HicA-like mRNA interferase family)